ncbi:hypothetical protein ACWGI8_12060 [Streptomyces sp. NPDC054841]
MGALEGASSLKLYSTHHGVTEIAPRLAEAEAHVQRFVEANMEALLGVRLLESEYSTGPVHGGRIDSLGIDENGARGLRGRRRGRCGPSCWRRR